MKIFLTLLIGAILGCSARAEDVPIPPAITKEQALIEAAFRLDLKKVRELLEQNVSVNVKYGKHADDKLFQDPWTLGHPMGCEHWTALLALANSNRYPDPPRVITNTDEDREWSLRERERISSDVLNDRKIARLFIAKELIDVGAGVDADDSYGGTPLIGAIGNGFSDLALLLIEKGANVDACIRTYIDNPSKQSVMHHAAGSPEILAALISKGAKLNVQDDMGSTPLHDAVMGDNIVSVKLLLDAGANPTIRDKNGRTPRDLVHNSNWHDVKGRMIEAVFTDFENKKHKKTEQSNR